MPSAALLLLCATRLPLPKVAPQSADTHNAPKTEICHKEGISRVFRV